MNELFNTTHSKGQTYQFTLKIYKILFNFKTVLKSIRDVATSKLRAIFHSRLIFQNFLNLVHQICFEILIYYDSTNKAILINIELTHLLFVFVLRVYFFQLSLIALFSYSFSLLSIIIFVDVTIFFIFTSAMFRYLLFISFIFMILFIFAFKKIDFVIFRFHIYFERKIIEIMFIEIFDYQIARNKNLDVYRHKNLNFQLLMKKLTKKKLLIQSNLQKTMYDINNDRFVFDDK